MIPASPIALWGLAVLGAVSGASRAGAIPVRVDFQAPAGCSSGDAFYTAVLSRVERARRAAPDETALRLQVRLTRVRNRVEGELRVLDGRGGADRRTVSGASCDEVVEGLSLTAALALEQGGEEPALARPAARAPTPTPARPSTPASGEAISAAPAVSSPAPSASPARPARPPEPAVPSPPSTAPSIPPSPPPSSAAAPPSAEPPPPPRPREEPTVVTSPASPPEAPGRLGLVLGAGAVVAGMVSPYFSTGGALSVRLVTRPAEGLPASLGLSALHLPSRLLVPDEELVLDFTGAALTACPGWGMARGVTVEPCARAMGGWIEASNDAVTNPLTVGRTWWSVGALARAALRLGAGFSLEMEVGFAVPLVERRFVTTTPERLVGETPTISTMVGLGLVRGL